MSPFIPLILESQIVSFHGYIKSCQNAVVSSTLVSSAVTGGDILGA